METHFASPERSNDDQLAEEVEFASRNPVINGLLHSVSGLLAVLNEHRQILALNDSLLETLGIDNAEEALGLRPGEALKCIHSGESPGGCGTSRYCSTCGAAISIVSSLAKDQAVEKECALTREKSGRRQDLYFRVRGVPITFGARRLVLLFLQDITYQQRLAALERVFFHDINGLIQGILTSSRLISLKGPARVQDSIEILNKLSLRLANEVSMQQCLSQTEACVYQPVFSPIPVAQVFQEIEDVFSHHPAAKGRRLSLQKEIPDICINTDPSLLVRVLCNMITNAFEETREGDEIKVWAEPLPDRVVFCVWNRKPIPPDIAQRIFQRNFSTKSKFGRGLGTYSMKLFGEEILGGIVDFTSSEAEGTVFRFNLPVKA